MAGFTNNTSNIFGKLLNSAIKGTNKSLKVLASAKRELNGAELSVLADLEAAVKINTQGASNASNSSLALNVADSSVSQISSIQTRMQELATQSANGVYSDEQRAALSEEFNALREEANRIQATSEFNGQNVLSGGEVATQLGDTSLSLAQADLTDSLTELDSLDISTQSGAQSAIDSLDTFGSNLSRTRSVIGANQTRLSVAESQLESKALEEEIAASTIRDVDIASELAKKVSSEITSKAAVAVFAQANQNQSKVADLLRT